MRNESRATSLRRRLRCLVETLAFELSLRGFRGNAESAVTVEVVKPEIRGTVTAIDKDF